MNTAKPPMNNTCSVLLATTLVSASAITHGSTVQVFEYGERKPHLHDAEEQFQESVLPAQNKFFISVIKIVKKEASV